VADSKKAVEKELKAIQEIIGVLSGMEASAIGRVLKYSLEHLGVSIALPGVSSTADHSGVSKKYPIAVEQSTGQIIDIKSLKESKSPSSGIEMAAVVGFYLAECAPEADRKTEFGVKDAEKYFKQAQFKLPPKMHFTLNNAKNAGYLDSAGHGKFKLNPVGYNLVAHNLPGKSSKK
jgi:hypothetical protein